MVRLTLLLAFASLALFAQQPAPAVSKEAALELQLIDAQQRTAAEPFDAIIKDLQAAFEKVKAQREAALSPMASRYAELLIATCRTAGISEDDTRAGKCVVNTQTLTVERRPEPAKR